MDLIDAQYNISLLSPPTSFFAIIHTEQRYQLVDSPCNQRNVLNIILINPGPPSTPSQDARQLHHDV